MSDGGKTNGRSAESNNDGRDSVSGGGGDRRGKMLVIIPRGKSVKEKEKEPEPQASLIGGKSQYKASKFLTKKKPAARNSSMQPMSAMSGAASATVKPPMMSSRSKKDKKDEDVSETIEALSRI